MSWGKGASPRIWGFGAKREAASFGGWAPRGNRDVGWAVEARSPRCALQRQVSGYRRGRTSTEDRRPSWARDCSQTVAQTKLTLKYATILRLSLTKQPEDPRFSSFAPVCAFFYRRVVKARMNPRFFTVLSGFDRAEPKEILECFPYYFPYHPGSTKVKARSSARLRPGRARFTWCRENFVRERSLIPDEIFKRGGAWPVAAVGRRETAMIDASGGFSGPPGSASCGGQSGSISAFLALRGSFEGFLRGVALGGANFRGSAAPRFGRAP